MTLWLKFNRNEVWRYNRNVWGHPRLRIIKFLFRGLPLGLAAAIGTVAFEEYFEVYKDHGGHGSHDEHHNNGAHGQH